MCWAGIGWTGFGLGENSERVGAQIGMNTEYIQGNKVGSWGRGWRSGTDGLIVPKCTREDTAMSEMCGRAREWCSWVGSVMRRFAGVLCIEIGFVCV